LTCLHLPMGASAGLMTRTSKTSPGSAPQGLADAVFGGLYDLFVVVVELIIDVVMSVANFIVDLGRMVVDLGMKVLGDLAALTTQAVQAVRAAVEAIQNAFNAFVAWAIELITSTLNEVFGPIVGSIKQVVDNYGQGVAAALAKAESDYSATGRVSSSTLSFIYRALGGDLYQVLVALTVAISVAVLSISIVTNVFSFLLTFAISLVVTMLIEQAFNMGHHGGAGGQRPVSTVDGGGNIDLDGMRSDIENSGLAPHVNDGSEQAERWNAAWSIFGMVASQISIKFGIAGAYIAGFTTVVKIGLVASLAGLALSGVAIATGNMLLGFVSLGVSAIGLIIGAKDLFAYDTGSKVTGLLATASGLIGIGCSVQAIDFNNMQG
jgi:hypothetical protein